MSEPQKCTREVLVFTQADTTFGLDARCVEAVSETAQITPLPKAEKKLRGIMNYKGSIVPVFSLFGLLGLPVTDTEKICLIVKDKTQDPLALTIECAQGLHKEETTCMPPPEGLHLGEVQLDAILRAEQNICIIDLAKTFQKQ